MPPNQALHSLDVLRDATNANVILETLKGAMHGKLRPSDLKLAKGLTATTSIALELLAKHAITFINLQPSQDAEGLPERQVDQLTELSGTRRRHSYVLAVLI